MEGWKSGRVGGWKGGRVEEEASGRHASPAERLKALRFGFYKVNRINVLEFTRF
jgi:hypothetical protein